MANILMRLFTEDLEGFEPEVRDLKDPIRILGMAADTTMSRIYQDAPALGKRFSEFKKSHPIPSKKEPWGFTAVSQGFARESGAFTYLMGDVVTDLDRVPAGLTGFEIPAGLYAVFPVRPKNRFAWGLAIANVKRYAYGKWLPRSGYDPAGTVDDFEYHDERSLRKRNPQIDLYVAVRAKR
ncbi:MAG: effector binding domain-containing protein [Anaerolineales bacterium]|nr:effector binding domain-containing protein [Anaerolineales bacterium]